MSTSKPATTFVPLSSSDSLVIPMPFVMYSPISTRHTTMARVSLATKPRPQCAPRARHPGRALRPKRSPKPANPHTQRIPWRRPYPLPFTLSHPGACGDRRTTERPVPRTHAYIHAAPPSQLPAPSRSHAPTAAQGSDTHEQRRTHMHS
jgi:hypothetical protein